MHSSDVSPLPLFFLLLTIAVSSPVFAGVADEPHLNIVPRTAAETERVRSATAPSVDFGAPSGFEKLSAGAATVRTRTDADAFSQPSGNMEFEDELFFKMGNGLFRKLWVSSPSSTLASDGLGPLYNARSCQRCHLKDGRGHPPEHAGDTNASLFLRISVPGAETDIPGDIEGYISTLPDPGYGNQLQNLSVAGHPAEIRLDVAYDEFEVPLSDGEAAFLRRPTYSISNPGYGPLHPDAMFSPRVAPPMIGLGMLEAIRAEDILARVDADDQDGDGISGRANIVWSVEYDQPMLGRFGLKAGAPTVRHQSAGAFAGDIGISTPLFPDPWGECTPEQHECRGAPHGDGDKQVNELSAESLDLVTFYSRNLGVPARRDVDDRDVLRGKQVFYETGCTACHTPSYVTHRLEDEPEQSFQLIWPYSDLLLHDMGEGLADNRPEARATGREWRTPPLWGIGLTEQVSGHTYLMHDGRARNLLEAVLWHDGEAAPAKEAVIAMPKPDRDALIRFLESL